MSKKKLVNHVALVVDESSSMAGIRDETINAFNHVLGTIQARSRETGQETFVTLVKFSDPPPSTLFCRVRAEDVKPLTRVTYCPYGWTALFDGVGTAVGEIGSRPRNHPLLAKGDNSYLVIAFTDGEENSSRAYGRADFHKMLADRQATGEWTFVFNLPPGKKAPFVRQFGIPEDNCREWEATAKGVYETQVVNSAGLDNYYAARSSGKRSVQDFFVTVDLSAVKASDLKKLTDVSHRFKDYAVDKECRADDFVRYKTGGFKLGCVFYQLTKPEKVQGHKEVLIREKGKKAVYGGRESRGLIGLPHGGDCKVTPGNHMNYDIFVQSKAPNRKLVRGTRVLIDVTLAKDLDPTWVDPKKQGAAP